MSFPNTTVTNGTDAQNLLVNKAAGAGVAEPTGGLSQLDMLSYVVGNMLVDAPPAQTVLTTSSVKSSSTSAGIGYATGAGGTVTQATDKSTGVTLNKMCGAITMNNATLNAGVEASFTLTNSSIAVGDLVLAIHSSAGTAGSYLVNANAIAAGSCGITVSNASAGNLGEAIVISFMVFKGVSA